MKLKKSYLVTLLLLFILAACSDNKKTEEPANDADEIRNDQDAEEIQPDEDLTDEEVLPDKDQSEEETLTDEDNAEVPDERAKSPDFEDLECGASFGDYACDFTLPLDSGDWNFAENYSKDENYLLVFYRGMNSTSKKSGQHNSTICLIDHPIMSTISSLLRPIRLKPPKKRRK